MPGAYIPSVLFISFGILPIRNLFYSRFHSIPTSHTHTGSTKRLIRTPSALSAFFKIWSLDNKSVFVSVLQIRARASQKLINHWTAKYVAYFI